MTGYNILPKEYLKFTFWFSFIIYVSHFLKQFGMAFFLQTPEQLKLFIVFWKLFINVEFDNLINNQGLTFASFASAFHVLSRTNHVKIFIKPKTNYRRQLNTSTAAVLGNNTFI